MDVYDLDIYITDLCNYRCPYCYNKDSRSTRRMSPETFRKCVTLVRESGLLVRPNFLGGEPLLNKNLPEFIKEIAELQNVPEIQVTTNGSIPLKNLFSEIGNLKGRLKIILSFHGTETEIPEFENAVQFCIDENVKFLITLNVYNNTDKIKYFLWRYDNENLHVNFIAANDEAVDDVLPKFNINGHYFTERQIRRLKLNRFSGKRCKNRWWQFTVDGRLSPGCQCASFDGFKDSIICETPYCPGGIMGLNYERT